MNSDLQENILSMETLGAESVAQTRGVICLDNVKIEIGGGTQRTQPVQSDKNHPKSVKIGYINYSAREYIPKPLGRCKCQRMGHTAQQCKGKMEWGT